MKNWNLGLAVALVLFASDQETIAGKRKQDLPAQVKAVFESSYSKRQFTGLSAVLIQKGIKPVEFHLGYRDVAKKLPTNEYTVYELGSITKTFSRLFLALHPEINLDDSISKYLPQGIETPAPQGSEIRIQDLALHTGFRFGLPCIPQENDTWKCFGISLNGGDSDPYKNAKREDLLQYVNAYAKMLKTGSGAQATYFPRPGLYYEYSNAGAALLGEILSMKFNQSFAELIEDQILDPLQMHHTYVMMENESDDRNLAKVYRPSKEGKVWNESSLWHFQALASAGSIRSTIQDMTKYLQAQMGLLDISKPISDAIKITQTELPRAEADLGSNLCPVKPLPSQACNRSADLMYQGWPVEDLGGRFFFFGGATGASTSMIMLSEDHELGVVILANSARPDGKINVPNDTALCIFQMAGKVSSTEDLCRNFTGSGTNSY